MRRVLDWMVGRREPKSDDELERRLARLTAEFSIYRRGKR